MVQKIQFKTIIRIQLAIFILALFLSIGCYQKIQMQISIRLKMQILN